jgi:bifunctional oligoribonuclease and PAP phosphatase NrnA
MACLHTSELLTMPFDAATVAGAWKLITAARSIAVIPHTEADGDAIGACCALSDFLLSYGKMVEVIYMDALRDIVPFHARHERVGSHSRIPDLVITVDVANSKRCYYPAAFHHIPLINIDHHRDNSVGGTFTFIDSRASSSCEVLYLLMTAWDKTKISLQACEALLYGVLDDSIIFRTQLTTARTLQVATLLADAGVDYQMIKEQVRNYRAPFVVRVWANLLRNLKTVAGKSISVVQVSLKDLQDAKADRMILGGFVNFVADLIDSDIVLLLVEKQPGVIKGSFRSKRANVAQLAAVFGGGGHVNAAGFEVKGAFDEIERTVLSKI